jgi:hypothetical protein
MVMESYFVTHTPAKDKKRGKRKRVNLYDPNASKADKRYIEDYGL